MGEATTIGYARAAPRSARVRTPSVLRSLGASIFWCVAAIFILGLLFAAIYFTIPFALVVAPLLSILLVTSAAEAARQVRRQRGMTVLGYLHQATRLNLPLATMLASAASAERGRTRRRLRELNELMQMGLTVHQSLQMGVPELPDRAIQLIAAAEANGTLPQTLERLLDENGRAGATDPVNLAFHRSYPLAISLMIVLVLSMFTIFVMPKYEYIFRDFGVQLPAITVFVLQFSRTLMVPLSVALVIVSMFVAARAVERFFVVRPVSLGWLRAIRDRLIWVTPLAHQADRDSGLADIFQTMSDATQNGQSFTRAADEASRLRVNVVLSRRLDRFRNAMERGATPAEAARQAGLPAIAVGLLSTARAGGDAAAVLGFLARYYRARFSRTRALIAGAIVPSIALAMGVCVGAIAMAMFLPLHRLVEATAEIGPG
jgi:type IV pilus assembly protein PilC